MGRPPKWQSETTVIRVPAHCADLLLNIATMLDKQSFVQNSKQELIDDLIDGLFEKWYAQGLTLDEIRAGYLPYLERWLAGEGDQDAA